MSISPPSPPLSVSPFGLSWYLLIFQGAWPLTINMNEHLKFDNIWCLVCSFEIRWGVKIRKSQWFVGSAKMLKNSLNNVSPYGCRVYCKKVWQKEWEQLREKAQCFGNSEQSRVPYFRIALPSEEEILELHLICSKSPPPFTGKVSTDWTAGRTLGKCLRECSGLGSRELTVRWHTKGINVDSMHNLQNERQDKDNWSL